MLRHFFYGSLVFLLCGCEFVYSTVPMGVISYSITDPIKSGKYYEKSESKPAEIRTGSKKDRLLLILREMDNGKESKVRYHLLFKTYQDTIFATCLNPSKPYFWFKAKIVSQEKGTCLHLLMPKVDTFSQFIAEKKLPGTKGSADGVILDKLQDKDYQFLLSQKDEDLYDSTFEFCK